MIAAAVFFGLRSGGTSAPTRAAEQPAEKTVTPAVAPRGASAARARPALDNARANAAARAALAAAKPAISKKCWEPAVATDSEPASVSYQLDVSFDANGRQVSRGVIERRDRSRADVARCLRSLPMTLRIPAPGVRVRTTLQLAFP